MKFKIRFIFLVFVSVSLICGIFPTYIKTETPNVNFQESQELELFVHFNKYSQYSSLWGETVDNRQLAFLGTFYGTSIIDVTEPGETGEGKEIAFIPGPPSSWREMKAYFDPFSNHTYLYVVTEGYNQSFPGGLQIIDLSLPNGPELVATNNETFFMAHTISIDRASCRIFINGPKGVQETGMIILDIRNPLSPTFLGSYDLAYVHDSYIRNNFCYAALIYDGMFQILDVSDPKAIKVLAEAETPQKFTHSTYLTDDGNFLFVVDEVKNNYLLIYDIRDLKNIKLVTQFRDQAIPPSAILHQFIVRKNFVYCAWYSKGIRVIDISDISNPTEVGHFLTYQGMNNGFIGCWGVYLDQRGYIYGSDMYKEIGFLSGGLFVVRFP